MNRKCGGLELQQQNEEFLETKRRLEAYRDRYIDLYDFAPLGLRHAGSGRVRPGDQPGRGQDARRGARTRSPGIPSPTSWPKTTERRFSTTSASASWTARDVASELRLVANGGPNNRDATPQHPDRRSQRRSLLQDGDHRHHAAARHGGHDPPIAGVPPGGHRRHPRHDVGHRPRLPDPAGQPCRPADGRGDRPHGLPQVPRSSRTTATFPATARAIPARCGTSSTPRRQPRCCTRTTMPAARRSSSRSAPRRSSMPTAR